ncbi:RNA polymerase Rpb1, domain 5 [Dillenia turbinata]|uniref:DNA-directed RNA polymerase subunit n=1 Tax=Dillenia turbinata TaxID=194707 RepID=A0AAN8W525_9MAGN
MRGSVLFLQGASESVLAVRFGFFTEDEVKRLSVKKITRETLFEPFSTTPLAGGLYDAALGPLDYQSPCKTCGQRSMTCPGHFGHIDLVSPVYNPLLFNLLYNILRNTCFYCHKFRATEGMVVKCISKLELILKGDIVGAKDLETIIPSESPFPEDSNGSHISYSASLSGAQRNSTEQLGQSVWTSLQYTEAESVLHDFLLSTTKKCNKCQSKNPNITKPTFGWLRMTGMRSADIRGNIIKGHTLKESSENANDSLNWGTSSDVVDADSSAAGSSGVTEPVNRREISKNMEVPLEYLKQKEVLSGHLLPSQVKNIIRDLWQNEAPLCSFISNLRQEPSQRNAGYSMFFLDTVPVTPIKFRPPAMTHDTMHFVLFFVVVIVVVVGQRDAAAGICQLIEKKEGIFRQKMMGKRVNFACRSVISPDPYLAVNEIGIPPYFALRLTYPERVTPWNVDKLRNAIVNGPEIHPGATHYVDGNGTVKLQPIRKMRIPISRKLPSSRGAVLQRGKSCQTDFENKTVLRHLQDGDIVLVNRQPTLHKPSIMAHVVRVLKGEKTIRMHYANCSTYNADFDGDEMNVHFPQDEISRAEAYNIVNANNQYIVPTGGDPERGLIQDHIVSAVVLTMKDTFLTGDQFNQLLYCSGVSNTRPHSLSGKPGKKVSIISEDQMQLVLPAIWKPEPLWTGKQVITAVLNHITKGRTPFTVEARMRTPAANIRGENIGSGEAKFLIKQNELVHGVIDKAQFGKYGLVHTVQELYGSNTAGILLSALSRLFTVFLQMHGSTCGVGDLLMKKQYDIERTKLLEKGHNVGAEVHAKFVGIEPEKIDRVKLQKEIEKAIRSNGESAITRLDRMMSSALNMLNTEVNEKLFPRGLLKPFPMNCLSLMTTTGAKGSMVNFTQISSLLGQQELEGKRVPRMVSGKTLPCFPSWDWSARAGGFISDRFLTGLRPQEYYFHCMAGREGLVDTAVKTSRSGYLQRCLIKNLEGLKVSYDHTVRDADGSIIQFTYGEDGVDVLQTKFLDKFDALAVNQKVIKEKLPSSKFNAYIKELPSSLEEKALKFICSLSKVKREQKDFLKLIKGKYISSLAQPGEPVGVLAAQSIGQPSTQMTLNTFHLAGRGEMNVTLGIPRLQEILMTASANIKTPIMTCPLREGSTSDNAERLAAKLTKVSVADIIERMEVCVVPFCVDDNEISGIYKLRIKIYDPALYPQYTDISFEDIEETLKFLFVRELEDTIHNHINLLSRISGIKNFLPATGSKASSETDEDASTNNRSDKEKNGDEDHASDTDDDGGDDLGLDAQKRKQQATDDIDYEDASESEGDVVSMGLDKENDFTDNEVEQNKDGEVADIGANDDNASEMPAENQTPRKPESDRKRVKSMPKMKRKGKEADRAIFVSFEGLHFEVHFRFTYEPHILMAQIAQKAAKRVYVKSSGNIDRCQVIEYRDGSNQKVPALQTAGVDFSAFWEMQEELDVNRVSSNDIHAILNTYGVEAARATIIKEVMNVFGSYGISVDVRHLSLIADFMTHTGGYRPMSRVGAISESISPFTKMSFETAGKFIVEASYRGERDDLEAPSARICLGQPVKMGTGCFDLLQKVDF